MIISFDLDDTLIPGQKTFSTEGQNLIQKLAGIERIRKGTVALFEGLRSRGHTIYIYTTSFRPVFKINLMFFLYGIPVDKVINQAIHDRRLKDKKTMCSKFPPAFEIDLHVDDSPGLAIEGEKFGFSTIIIDEGDLAWTNKVLEISGTNSLRHKKRC